MLTSIGNNNQDSKRGSFFSDIFIVGFALLFLTTVGLWITVQLQGTTDAKTNYYYSLFLGLVPFVASLKGLAAAKQWGGMKSVLGRSIGALAIGVLAWSIGELIWSYYNLVLEEAAPYPSIADLFFGPCLAFWIMSSLFLSRLAGANLILKKKPALWWLVGFVVLAGTALSYYLLVVLAREGQLLSDTSSTLKVILDIFYPLADFVSVTVVLVVMSLAGKYIGGKLRLPIYLMILGLAVMYIGDVMFGYATTKETFYNANFGDFVLLIGMTLLSCSLIAFSETVPRIGSSNKEKTAVDGES